MFNIISKYFSFVSTHLRFPIAQIYIERQKSLSQNLENRICSPPVYIHFMWSDKFSAAMTPDLGQAISRDTKQVYWYGLIAMKHSGTVILPPGRRNAVGPVSSTGRQNGL